MVNGTGQVWERRVRSVIRRWHRRQSMRKWGRFFGLLCLGVLLWVGQPGAIGQPPAVTPEGVLAAIDQGQVAFEQGDYQGAIQTWRQAQTRQPTTDLNQAVLAINLTQAHLQLGEWQQAEAAIATAFSTLAAAPASRDRDRLHAQALNTQGSLHMAQGQLKAALTAWEQAPPEFAALDDVQGQIRSQLNQAQVLQLLGFYRRSQGLLTQVTQHLEHQPDSSLKATGFRLLGNVLWQTGDRAAATQALNHSVQVATAIASETDISAALLSQGALAESQGEWQTALDRYHQVATTAPQTLTQLQARINQYRVAVTHQQWSMVQPLHAQIQQLLPSVPRNRSSLFAQLSWQQTLLKAEQDRLADSHRAAPQLASYKAIGQQLATLEQQARRLGDVRSHAYALGTLGHLYETTQQYSEALKLTQQALQRARSAGANDLLYQWQWQLGRLHEAMIPAGGEHHQTAIAHYRATIETLGTVRQDLLAIQTDQQFDFRDTVEPVYRQYVDLLLRSAPADPQQLELALDTLDALRIAELENFLRCNLEDRGRGSASLADVDPNAVLVFPILLDQRLELIYQLPGQALRHRSVPIRRQQITQTVEDLHESLTQSRATDDAKLAAQHLYDWLIDPIRADLDQWRPRGTVPTLAFVLEPTLQNIPMGVLYDQGRYLIEDFAIAVVPSRQLFDPSPRTGHFRVLAAGISQAQEVDGLYYQAIPNVKAEIEGIHTMTRSQGSVLLNQRFTEQRLQADLNPNKIPVVHIATHGQFSSDPEQTFLLAWGEKLKLSNLDQLLRTQFPETRARIELLVLSACETAKGNPRAALGLAGAAVQADVRTTVATLWQVNDRSTAQLMQRFYQTLIDPNHQYSIAEALRQAQLSFLRESGNRRPHFWAPFVVVGNWL